MLCTQTLPYGSKYYNSPIQLVSYITTIRNLSAIGSFGPLGKETDGHLLCSEVSFACSPPLRCFEAMLSRSFRGNRSESAGMAAKATGAASWRFPAAQKQFDNSCRLIPSAFPGMALAIAGTALSTAGAACCRYAAAHKQFESACGIILWTSVRMRSATQGTKVRTSGVLSCRFAAAHIQFDRCCGNLVLSEELIQSLISSPNH